MQKNCHFLNKRKKRITYITAKENDYCQHFPTHENYKKTIGKNYGDLKIEEPKHK
jgi:hypothetical protein